MNATHHDCVSYLNGGGREISFPIKRHDERGSSTRTCPRTTRVRLSGAAWLSWERV
jgi:hypothetical protein